MKCKDCKHAFGLPSTGICKNCGAGIGNVTDELCPQCSIKLNECEHCRKQLTADDKDPLSQ